MNTTKPNIPAEYTDWEGRVYSRGYRDAIAALSPPAVEGFVLVPRDWLEDARSILWGVAGEDTERGRLADGLGQSIPAMLAGMPALTPAGNGVTVDAAAVDRFWAAYSEGPDGGGLVRYRDVRRLLTAALAPAAATINSSEIDRKLVVGTGAAKGGESSPRMPNDDYEQWKADNEPADPPAAGEERLDTWAERVAVQFDAMGESYDARKLRSLLAWAQAETESHAALLAAQEAAK